MNNITDFRYQENSSFVGWIYSGSIVKKLFDFDIYAILLKSQQKVLVIESINRQDNAVIFNADGSEYRRIKNPDSHALCFGDVYYVNDELTLISRRRDASMTAVVIDENGDLIRTHETR
jgi:hypothetical protein